ncbi:MAG: FHA domain-containing protein, partial [Planctomycetota bacterium]|nr:FHA domain-containing protein [Planctomycetota bacterium]
MAEAAQYWCYKKIVVTIQTGKKTVQRVFPRPYVVIGRDPKCDLVLEDPDLRGHLLYLNANEYGLYCTPLNPESSTLPQGWLAANDWITLGRFKIRACLQDQENETSVPSPSWPRLAEYGSTLAPLPEVAIYRKSELLARRKIRALLTLVGRNEPSLIRIPSRNLSRCHCALFWDSGTLWFIDLKSRSHCFVDGLKRKVGRLDPGVRLKIGQYEIEFVGQEGRYVTPAAEVVNTKRENAASAVGEEPEKLVNLSSMPNTETPKEALVDALQPLQDPDQRNPQSEDQGDNSTVSTDDVSGDHGPELAEQLAIKTQAFEAAVKTCDALKIDLEQHRARAKESKALLEQKVEELNKELRRARETSAENGVIKDKEREKRKELEETLKQQESIVHQMREQLATGAEEQS